MTIDTETTSAMPPRKAPKPTIKTAVKPLIVFSVLAGCLMVVYFSPLRDHLRHFEEIKSYMENLGSAGPLFYMATVFLLISLGFPRLLFCPLGGLLFGFLPGLIFTQIPTLLGYYVIFLFVRWGGREFVLRHWPKLGRFNRMLARGTVAKVILIRQTPISGLVINLLLGISPIRHRHFLIGTAIGLLPEAIPFTMVAGGVTKSGSGERIAYIVGAAALLVVLWGGMFLFSRRSKALAVMEKELAEVEQITIKDAAS
jgi:uncharacterized membrane protein YdjX (TVP38/TMEM64 family)